MDMQKNKSALIIGAGPAGLTAGLELIRAGYQVTILEQDQEYVGGISRTVRYKDYRFDIGGHRFFSKNDDIVRWWYDIMGEDFLKRPRVSRWLYQKKFFNYPIELVEIVKKFGLGFALKIGTSLLYRKLFPIKPVENLEDWFINSFGDALAHPFFIEYNKKLWGIPCKDLSLDFASQRIKGVSVWNTIIDSFKKTFGIKTNVKSFIDEFNYPKHGPGELWEKVAGLIVDQGGSILMGRNVSKLFVEDNRITKIEAEHQEQTETYQADLILSTMPYNELAQKIFPALPDDALYATQQLKYRDFVTVALVIDKPFISKDTWVYTHDEGLKPIRFQNFRNWSPYMVPNDEQTVIGLEYTCDYQDEFWSMSDDDLLEQGIQDFLHLGFAQRNEISDGCVVKLRNVYPVYQTGYQDHVNCLRQYLDPITNLHPFGRGGIHRYNNTDHSMMTAILTVKNILANNKQFDVFMVNQDAAYHEEK